MLVACHACSMAVKEYFIPVKRVKALNTPVRPEKLLWRKLDGWSENFHAVPATLFASVY